MASQLAETSGPATASNGPATTNWNVLNGYTRRWMQHCHENKKPFDEALYETSLSKETLGSLVQNLKAATEAKVALSPRLCSDNYTYTMLIHTHRTPHVPVHLLRLQLPNTLLNEDSHVCLFVKDLTKNTRKPSDVEKTIKHYEALLKSKKITDAITVIPLSQLLLEYPTYEQRRKLTYLFDKFLVDQSIATKVNAFLGDKLLSEGKAAIPIDLTEGDLATVIDGSMRTVFITYNNYEHAYMERVTVGRHSMTTELIVENILDLLKQLESVHPGGIQNIKWMALKPNSYIYLSELQKVYVDNSKPEAPPKKVKPVAAAVKVAGEASTDAAVVDDSIEGAHTSAEDAAEQPMETDNDASALDDTEEVLVQKAYQCFGLIHEDFLTVDFDYKKREEFEHGDARPVTAAVKAEKAPAKPVVTKTKATQNGTAKKANNAVATVAPGATKESIMNDLIMKGLKKLMASQGIAQGPQQGATSNKAIKNYRTASQRNVNRNPHFI